MKFDFYNSKNEKLSGRLELPSTSIKAFALFAHCFTCSKNVKAASLISKTLAKKGIAVLRFDFTGIGNSEGDFSNTNFSSNVEDLVMASKALAEEFQAPKILIGHSLGGAAVLKAAAQLPEVESVVTVGAPSCVKHVDHLFEKDIERIKSEGEAEVDLFGRSFKIKKQFIEDINETDILEAVSSFKKSLLVMHSPVDNIVSVDHAANIFIKAKHPKSFVSLDNADHLVSRKEDSEYIAEIISGWVTRYVPTQEESLKLDEGVVLVKSRSNSKYTHDVHTKKHQIMMDEPRTLGGDDLGMPPYDVLLASLGGCTSMTMKMYAARKEFPLEDVEIELKHEKVQNKEDNYDHIVKKIKLIGEQLTSEQKERLMEIADKCPIHRTLHSEVRIESDNV